MRIPLKLIPNEIREEYKTSEFEHGRYVYIKKKRHVWIGASRSTGKRAIGKTTSETRLHIYTTHSGDVETSLQAHPIYISG